MFWAVISVSLNLVKAPLAVWLNLDKFRDKAHSVVDQELRENELSW